MSKSSGEPYEDTGPTVQHLWNMNVTPWVTGSSAEHVKLFFSALEIGNLFGSLCPMSYRDLVYEKDENMLLQMLPEDPAHVTCCQQADYALYISCLGCFAFAAIP